MPRSAAFLADALDQQIADTLDYIILLESNKQNIQGESWSLNAAALELSYEVAFLRLFGFWESFLEQLFLRLLCGYERGGVLEPLLAGQSYAKNLITANNVMLAGKNYVAWYVPSEIVGRCRKFFIGANFEFVIASANLILEDQSTLRHQIAHVQDHATSKFDIMTMRLLGKRVRGSRPGRLLRSRRPGSNLTWLDHFSGQLRGLANQLAR